MSEFIRNNLVSFILLGLLITLLVVQSRHRNTATEGERVVRDTVWVEIRNHTNVLPRIIERIPYAYHDTDTRYSPDTNYAILVEQYHALVEELLAKHILVDTLRFGDSLGYVEIRDTVSRNSIVGRSYFSHLRMPSMTETVYQPMTPRGMLYLGGGMSWNGEHRLNQMSSGLLYQFKSDVILGASFGFNAQSGLSYGLQGYWPLHRK